MYQSQINFMKTQNLYIFPVFRTFQKIATLLTAVTSILAKEPMRHDKGKEAIGF